MAKISIADIMEMSVSERILLVQDLWDSIAAAPESVRLSEAQRDELDSRLEGYHRNPEIGSAWQEVKARVSKES